jgi:MYXO-CTERM domain-containing protein
MHTLFIFLAGLLGIALWSPSTALACGGFFCSSSPVDQSSERIIFALNDDATTDMIVQIAYQGDSKDFAWLLPLAEVPDPKKLATFPEQAMTSLDTGTAPQFSLPSNCLNTRFAGPAGGGAASGIASVDAGAAVPTTSVSVYIRQTVGPYDVAVIGSDDAAATYQWLIDNGYRITGAMNEFVKLYTAEHMKFLALKLTDTADVSEIQPFRMRLPGESPSIPLRLTSIAALPEMGIVVWIFGKQRYEPAGEAREVEIAKEDLRWDPTRFYGFGGVNGTNWRALVARAADQNMGKAWVVEQAGPTDMLTSLISTQVLQTQDPRYEAQQALKDLLSGRTYMTRLYTRLSPEEMTYDPLFKRSTKGDVARQRELPFIKELCDTDSTNDGVDPCDFNPCGAYAMCRSSTDDDGLKVAACACAPGLTARAVPDTANAGLGTSVTCIDERLSFLNVGDRGPAGDVLPDPCVGVDCGENGKCVNMNMTATCECKTGFVARARRRNASPLTCVKPTLAIPSSFYGLRMPESSLPTGREVHVVEVEGPSAPATPPASSTPSSSSPSSSSSSCSAAVGQQRAPWAAALGMLLLGVAIRRRRASPARVSRPGIER